MLNEAEITTDSVKGSLAVVYFFDILSAIFFPLALLTEFKRRRIKKKTNETRLVTNEYIQSHLAWQGKMHKLLLMAILLLIAIMFAFSSLSAMYPDRADYYYDVGVSVIIWGGRFALISFLVMLFMGYVNLLIDKPIKIRNRLKDANTH